MDLPNHPSSRQAAAQFPPLTVRSVTYPRIAALAITAAAAFLPHTSSAIIWDTTPGDGAAITAGGGDWTLEAGNWNSSGTDLLWSNGEIATFAGEDAEAPNTYNINVGSGLTAQRINFNSTGYILNATAPTTLTLTADPSIVVAAGKVGTIGSNLTVFRNNGGITINGGGYLTLNGTVENTGSNMAITGGTTVEVTAGANLNVGASFVLGPTGGVGTDGTLLVTGGTVTTTNISNNGNFVLGNVAGVNARVTITAGRIVVDPAAQVGLRIGGSSALGAGASVSGTIDLDGGVLETRRIFEGNPGEGSITSTFNFNGGVLKVNNTPASGTFMTGLDVANVKAGGAHVDTNGHNVTISQVLTHDPELGATADGGFTKTGNGVLTLSGANTFTGPIKILGGTVSVNTLGNTTTANPLGLSSNASANFLLDGGALRFTGSSNYTSERGLTLGVGGGTIEIAHTGSNLGFRISGVITGSGDLTITRGNSNNGLFFGLSANNTYTGKTFVTNGAILEYRKAVSAGQGGSFVSGTEVTGATVRLDPGGSGGANAPQTYTEYFTLGEGGALENKSFDNTLTGTLALSGNGSARAIAGSLALQGPVVLNDYTLTFSPNDSAIYVDGGIAGGPQGSVAMDGNGLLIITGDSNTYAGTTTVSAGTLALDGTLSATSAVRIAGGTLELSAADRINDLAAVTMSGGTLSTEGFAENLGTFTLEGTAAIDLGTGASVLRFLDSSAGAANWTGTLTIRNWSGSLTGGGLDQIFFGSTGAGLTSEQLAMISFINPLGFEPGTYSARILPTGEVVAAVPEPGSVIALIGGIGVLALGRFRRRR